MKAVFVTCARQLDRLHPAVWLAALGAALWPHWIWMGRRMLDGSDDPLGVVALAALFWVIGRARGDLLASPRPAWFGAAILLAVAASLGWQHLPPLFASLLALSGLAAGMLAFLPARVPCLPVLGLSVLSLPLMASLQFYAGYPLRLLAAELSRWLLLLPGYQVERDGVALKVDGQLILVDAACSGVQLVWLGYFTACVTALMVSCGNARFMRRLPAVGALVLTGNVLRNAALVALQSDGQPLADWLHEGIGLVTVAVICSLIAYLMMRNPVESDGAKEANSA